MRCKQKGVFMEKDKGRDNISSLSVNWASDAKVDTALWGRLDSVCPFGMSCLPPTYRPFSHHVPRRHIEYQVATSCARQSLGDHGWKNGRIRGLFFRNEGSPKTCRVKGWGADFGRSTKPHFIQVQIPMGFEMYHSLHYLLIRASQLFQNLCLGQPEALFQNVFPSSSKSCRYYSKSRHVSTHLRALAKDLVEVDQGETVLDVVLVDALDGLLAALLANIDGLDPGLDVLL